MRADVAVFAGENYGYFAAATRLAVGLFLINAAAAQSRLREFLNLPVQLDWPMKGEWRSSGWDVGSRIELRKDSAAREFAEVDTSGSKSDTATIEATFLMRKALPPCKVTFALKSATAKASQPKEVEIYCQISAPTVLKGAFGVDARRFVAETVKVSPTKEWRVVEVPLEFKEQALDSSNNTFTVSLTFKTLNAKVAVDDLAILPAPKE
jgi:hypothetical protein